MTRLTQVNGKEPDLKPQRASPTPPVRKTTFPLRRSLFILGGFGVVALLFLALRPAPIAVDLGEVKRGDLQITVDAEGKTRVQDRFVVAAPVTGRLTRIELDPGDRVQQGTLVAQIDPLPLDTRVKEAQARLQELNAQLAGVETQRPKSAAIAQADARIRAAVAAQRQSQARLQEVQAALTQAQRDRQRAESLAQAGAISRQAREDAELAEIQQQQTVDAAQEALNGAIAEVKAAQNARAILRAEQRDPDYLLRVYRAQIASTEASLANLIDEARRTEIRSPEAGRVLRVLQESSRFVQAGDPLLEVGNLASQELVIDVLSNDAVNIKSGDPIWLEQWGGENQVVAKVKQVEPSAFTEISALGVEEQRVNIIGQFTKPSVPLGDGYRVDAKIVVWSGTDVLKLPISALFRCEQEWCVFVAENGQAHRRPVKIGSKGNFEVVVTQGLQENEQVILHPTEKIQAGKRITPR